MAALPFKHDTAMSAPNRGTRRLHLLMGRCLMLFVLLGVGWSLSTRGSADDVVTLLTGEKFTGTLIQANSLEVTIDTENQGRLTLPRSTIETIETGNASPPGPVAVDPSLPDASILETRLPLPPPAIPSAQIPLAPPPTLPTGTNFVARMEWDGHVRYVFSTRVALPDPLSEGATFLNDRLQLRGRIGAKLAVDGAVFSSQEGQQPVSDGIQLRTFQILTEGTVGLWLTNQYAVELGLIGGQFYLNKAYWRFVDLPHFGDLTIGYFTVPQTLENIMSFGSLSFMEPSAGTAAFSPGKRAGLEWHRTFYDQRMTASAGIFSVGQDPSINFGSASQTLAEPVFRVTALPWAERQRWMHLGVSYSYVFPQDAEMQYQARPESRLAPFLVNTGTIDANQASSVGSEAAWGLGPVLLQTEYFNSVVWADTATAMFHGFYFAGGWMLTGEDRPYNRATGIPTRVQPRHPLWGPDSGWGAWEAAGRYSYVDLDSAGINGGRMGIIMTGLNWYWNQYIRMQFNCGIANVKSGPSPGKLYLLEARFEGQF